MKRNSFRTKVIHLTYDKKILNKTLLRYYRCLKEASESMEKKKKQDGDRKK